MISLICRFIKNQAPVELLISSILKKLKAVLDILNFTKFLQYCFPILLILDLLLVIEILKLINGMNWQESALKFINFVVIHFCIIKNKH